MSKVKYAQRMGAGRVSSHHVSRASAYARAVVLMLPILFAGCMAGGLETSPEIGNPDPVLLPTVYSRYLAYPVPSSGIEAEFNPPILRWPIVKRDNKRYDVRLSMDSLFEEEGVIGETGSAWAMFNPHKKLATGKWYWQYRIADGAWSPIETFSVTERAVDLVTPPPRVMLEGIPKQRPRVLADPSEISRLRDSSDDADARAILDAAYAAMEGRIPSERDGIPAREADDEQRNRKFQQDASQRLGDFVYRTVVPLAQAHLITGEERFRGRAISIAMEVAEWDPSGVTGSGISDFSDARCMLAMAIAFDTFYADLTPNQRKTLSNAIHVRAEGFYRSWINNQEARVLSGHVWQHILHYLFQTALAMHGEDPAATDWLAYAYELFVARTPILGGTDGGWTEGVSYFRMNMETVIDIPLFIKKYTGFDFIKAHPWYAANVDWMIYHIPPGSSADGFGDNTEEVFSPGSEYVAYAKEVAKLTGNSRAAWYAAKCAEYESAAPSTTKTLRWIRLARTRHLPMPDPAVDPELPVGKVFRDIGLVSMHSNPENTRSNLMVAMRSGPFGCYGHFLADQNAFNILYGGKRTFFRTGYKITMQDPHRTGWYQDTKSNNSILVNGEGQPYSTEAFGWIPQFIQGRQIAYALGDASNAYSSEETKEDLGVRKFYRHLVMLKPDIIVIYDELESERKAGWSWLIHSMEEISLKQEENSFQSTFDHAKGVGKLWTSQPVTWALADTFDVPAVNWRGSRDAAGKLKSYDDHQWHLKAVTTAKSSATRFLAVLQVSPEASLSNLTGDVGTGAANVKVGKWTISANLNMEMPSELVIRDGDGENALIVNAEFAPRIIENLNGRETELVGRVVMPWYLEQSMRHYNAD